jgi:hypothetical protein
MKHNCLHWQKKVASNKIVQFSNYNFMPKAGKTSDKVIEPVSCSKKRWGNWGDF